MLSQLPEKFGQWTLTFMGFMVLVVALKVSEHKLDAQ